jgi:predicted metal-dependent peptidase
VARKQREKKVDPATEAFRAGRRMAAANPLLSPLLDEIYVYREQQDLCPSDGWAVVASNGVIHVHPTRRATPEQWLYVLAHCALHLGLGHFKDAENPDEWQAACDVFLARFLEDLKIGHRPVAPYVELPSGNEDALYRRFCAEGIPLDFRELSLAGPGHPDMLVQGERRWYGGSPPKWTALLANGLASAVAAAVEVAAGVREAPEISERKDSPSQRAKRWFISSYPLLGALAANFKIIEDIPICQRLDVHVAAVNPIAGEILMNPAAALSEAQCRFVMAHELLHVGLRHVERCDGRDFYLWNVACDFVINDWLLEMGVGEMPEVGMLHDPQLRGLSAEAVYDRIVTDLRRMRKLSTLRGVGKCDILDRPDGRLPRPTQDLDDFYRSCLSQGLELHSRVGRGFLPEGLVEEIRALNMPPIPWEVRLAQWFDGFIEPIERRRTYARPSRRQSSTPDLPRPRVVPFEVEVTKRTFGVVLDTSGSMETEMLAKGLGAIASYALSREVPAVRVVFCDAAAYDQGYMPAEAIADRVRVKGRGGTVLQPGIDLLQAAEDFPKEGPILAITDGLCDRIHLRREHAFLMPKGSRLPFIPRGPVFLME